MKKLTMALFGILLAANFAYAECPKEVTHDEARIIAKGDKNSHLFAQYEVNNMAEIAKKGTSKLYTKPKLILQNEASGNRFVCEYSYTNKVTKGKPKIFSFLIPKHQFDR